MYMYSPKILTQGGTMYLPPDDLLGSHTTYD